MARESFRASRGDEGDKINLPPSADELPDTVEVDLDNSDPNAFEIVEEDDTPEEDRGRPTSYDPDPSMDEQIDDLRVRGNKKKIEARIKRLSFERETERRAKEEAQRQLNAAIEAARMAQAEAQELRRTTQMSGTALADSMLARNEVALREAKMHLKQAHELGDTDRMVAAQEAISRLTAEELAIRSRMPTQQEQETQQQQYQPPQQPQYQQPQYQQPAQPSLAPNVAAWLSKNTWFSRPGNEAKTKLALSIHEALVSRGISPESADYTRELDRGLKAMYTDHQPFDADASEDDFDAEPKRVAKRPNVTADAGRENAVSQRQPSRTVTLTRSELSIAKRLGVSPQAYAAQKLKDMQRGGDGAN